LPYLDGEEMVVVLLGRLAGGVLSKKRLGYLLEIVQRAKRQRVEPIRCHTFQAVGKCDAQEWVFAGINHHLVPEMPDVLDGIVHSE